MNALGRSRWIAAIGLGVAVAGCLALLLLRAQLTGEIALRLLVWNLFLAAVPFPFAWLVDVLGRRPRTRWWTMVLPGVVWLLFFPNAPYLVTDLIHLKPSRDIPLWFDGLVFFSFAATGLLLGFASLYLVQATVARHRGTVSGWFVVVAAIALGSYGIYLGRIERWNSWDVLTSPRRLLGSVSDQVRNPLSNRTSIALTAGFAVFLTTVYLVLWSFAQLVRADAEDARR